MNRRLLFVAGAVSYDHLLYPMSPADDTNDRHNHEYQNGDAAQLVIRTGAADLVAQLLAAAAPGHGFEVSGPCLQPPASNCLKHNASTIVDLTCQDTLHGTDLTYGVARIRHVNKRPVWHAPATRKEQTPLASTVIITGSGEAFRDIEPALDFLQQVRPRYIIHHMTRPLATGALWDIIRDGPKTRDGIPDPDHLAVIIDADDLRAAGIPLSQSLSWEATAEDFVRYLGFNGRLDTLVTCPNLIVRFGTQGVIHHRGRDAVDPRLYYHPRRMERDGQSWQEGHMTGLASAFTAGLAIGFADSTPPNCEQGIRYGIALANRLARAGFRTSNLDNCPDYPIADIMENLVPDKSYACVSIPSGRISSGDKWSIFDSVTGDPAELARQIVTLGPDRALGLCPIQQFGDLLTIERSEQESLRAVVDAVHERIHTETPHPTSIGILGPPGAGKKFTASNVARYIGSDRPMQRLSYNARLLRLEDLTAACHSIRDSTASGMLTVVSFENFEAILERGHPLLNDFLVMMRDGTFTDRGHMRSLGSPLMLFLANLEPGSLAVAPIPITPTTSGNFRERANVDETLLLDHLHGVVRVTGPNQTGAQDKMFPVRRAIMLRRILKQKHPHLDVNGIMKVDDAVLHALLLVPSYKYGLRSLEKIVSTSRLSGRTNFDVSALPPEEQIQLHVEGRIFMSYLRSPKLPPALRERLAEGLFETYKRRRLDMAKSEAERTNIIETDRSIRDWEDLAPELKESTRAQADDIPRKLRAVRCFMLEEDRSDPLIRVPEFSTEDLDMLSEMEHERFNAERLQRQWRLGSRNSKQRTTPFLVPWRDLTQEWKDVDRVMVECVPRILDKAGWKIYRMREDVGI